MGSNLPIPYGLACENFACTFCQGNEIHCVQFLWYILRTCIGASGFAPYRPISGGFAQRSVRADTNPAYLPGVQTPPGFLKAWWMNACTYTSLRH